jgi:hypothetical protein
MKRLVTIATILCVCGCSKGGNSAGGGTTPTVSAKTQSLTAKDWMLQSSQYKSASASTWTDAYAQTATCDKDNHVIFRTDGTYETNEGATRCVASNPFIIETGTWKFAQSETLLTLVSGGKNKDGTIDVLDATTLSITYAMTIGGIVYTFKDSYGH